MGDLAETVVIEARSLMREALVSLIESHSYRVICSVGSIADIDRSVAKEAQPELVILGALPTDRVAEITSSIRSRWQDTKIVMLFENASAKDLHKMMAAGLDACVPVFASPRTLIDTLQLIVCEHLRVLMVGDETIAQALSDADEDEDDEVMPNGHPRVGALASSFDIGQPAMPCARDPLARSDGDGTAHSGCGHGLSEREEQVLRALVRGHSNKMIARMYSVTEATVKVHMKSILRKIRVANRTQAAIWAIRNARFSEDVNETDSRAPVGM
jgi:two-component system nitrate/nitrite response regulator NarL